MLDQQELAQIEGIITKAIEENTLPDTGWHPTKVVCRRTGLSEDTLKRLEKKGKIERKFQTDGKSPRSPMWNLGAYLSRLEGE